MCRWYFRPAFAVIPLLKYHLHKCWAASLPMHMQGWVRTCTSFRLAALSG